MRDLRERESGRERESAREGERVRVRDRREEGRRRKGESNGVAWKEREESGVQGVRENIRSMGESQLGRKKGMDEVMKREPQG